MQKNTNNLSPSSYVLSRAMPIDNKGNRVFYIIHDVELYGHLLVVFDQFLA